MYKLVHTTNHHCLQNQFIVHACLLYKCITLPRLSKMGQYVSLLSPV